MWFLIYGKKLNLESHSTYVSYLFVLSSVIERKKKEQSLTKSSDRRLEVTVIFSIVLH